MDLSGIIGELQDQRNIRDQCRSNSVTFINVKIAVEYLYKQQLGLEMVPHLTDLFSQFHSFAFVSHCLCLCDYSFQVYSIALRPLQSLALATSLHCPQLSYSLILYSHCSPPTSPELLGQDLAQTLSLFYLIVFYYRNHSIIAIDL